MSYMSAFSCCSVWYMDSYVVVGVAVFVANANPRGQPRTAPGRHTRGPAPKEHTRRPAARNRACAHALRFTLLAHTIANMRRFRVRDNGHGGAAAAAIGGSGGQGCASTAVGHRVLSENALEAAASLSKGHMKSGDDCCWFVQWCISFCAIHHC